MILPNLRQYSFFQGEEVDSIIDFGKKSSIEEAVRTLTDISKYEESDVNKIYFREKLSDNNGNNQRLLKERISKIFEKKSLIIKL